ncbi:SRPBCC family protein [Ornithinimicrobium flavum]|uniref:SRPBCC family protein n=1 Tax=Ornithinimicrobium flavum TaxID=1288636 RepID=UPI001070263D|nr:SRPBCC family protein [Ornithinimicrobium flavum]
MDVTVSTVYDAPRPLVAAVAGDPAHAERWSGTVHGVRWHGEPTVAAGSSFELLSRALGREMAATYRVVDLVPGERLVARVEGGAYPLEVTMTWWDEEPGSTGPRTGMALRRAGRPPVMATLGSGAVTLGMRRAMRRDLERLRLVLREEADAASRPGV